MRLFAVVVEPDTDSIGSPNSLTDSLLAVAHTYDVKPSEVEKQVEPYLLDGLLTIVFDLDGGEPRLLPNSQKGGVTHPT